MKKKTGLFAIIVFVSIVFDLGTKTIAENNLASRTRDFEHYLYLDVPGEAAEQSLRDFLVQELSWNSDEEVEEIANQSTFIVDDDGNWIRRGFAELGLEGGERLEIRERSVEMVDGFLYFRYTENRGAAWGFLSGFDSDLRQPFFIGVGILAMLHVAPDHPAQAYSRILPPPHPRSNAGAGGCWTVTGISTMHSCRAIQDFLAAHMSALVFTHSCPCVTIPFGAALLMVSDEDRSGLGQVHPGHVDPDADTAYVVGARYHRAGESYGQRPHQYRYTARAFCGWLSHRQVRRREPETS